MIFHSCSVFNFLFMLVLVGFSLPACSVELSTEKSSPQSSNQSSKKRSNPTHHYVHNRLLVRFKDGSITDATHAKVGAKLIKRFSHVAGLELVELPPGKSVEQAMAEYRKDPNVLYVEPDYIVHTQPGISPAVK